MSGARHLEGAVARRDARPAGRDQDARVVRRHLPLDPGADLGRLVAHDGLAGDDVAGRFEQRHDRRAAGVGGLGAGVADRQHRAADRRRAPGRGVRCGSCWPGRTRVESARAHSLSRAGRMTDVVTADPAAGLTPQRCANCGAALHGPFCCGLRAGRQAARPAGPAFHQRVRTGALRRRQPRPALLAPAVSHPGLPDARVLRRPPRALGVAAQAVSVDQRRVLRGPRGDRRQRRRAAHGDRRSERRQRLRDVRVPQPGRHASGDRRRAGRLDAARDVRARAVRRLAGRASRVAGPAATTPRTSSSRCTSMPPRSASGPSPPSLGAAGPSRPWPRGSRSST